MRRVSCSFGMYGAAAWVLPIVGGGVSLVASFGPVVLRALSGAGVLPIRSSQLRESKGGGEQRSLDGRVPALVYEAECLPIVGRLVVLDGTDAGEFPTLLCGMSSTFGAVDHGTAGWVCDGHPEPVAQ